MKYLVTVGGLINYCNMLMHAQNEAIAALQSKAPDRLLLPESEKQRIRVQLKDIENRLTILNNFILTRAIEINEMEAKSFFGKDLDYLKKEGRMQGKDRMVLT